MSKPRSFTFPTLILLAFGLTAAQADTASGAAAAEGRLTRVKAAAAVVEGKVVGKSRPVSEATVYAYEVATYALKKVLTDDYGRFLLGSLPAGMYKIIAFKEGFAPTIELLLRRREQESQYLEITMRDEAVGDVRQGEDYWSVRSRVPADVLRDIQSARSLWTRDERDLWPETRVAGLSRFEGEMLAHGGYEQLGAAYGEAHLTGAEFDLQGVVGAMQVGLNGRYQLLVPDGKGTGGHVPDAEARTVEVAVKSARQSKLSVATSSGQLSNFRDGDVAPVDMEHYQVQWSGRAGERGRSDVTAQYTEEANYHRVGWVDPIAVPEASRTWNLKGIYTGELSERTSLKAGLSYRQRNGEGAALASFAGSGTPGVDPLSDESIGVYGLAGSQIVPRVMVEYGLFSSVRDGSLSLMPHGGLVVDLGSDWKARTSFARRVESNEGQEPYHGFSSAFYSDTTSCRNVGEACYEVFFSRGGEEDSISLGAVHREYAETLRLYFSPDFFNRLESLFVVQGDQLPELQFSMVRHIAPKVLAKLESNIAAGGGGIFYATDEVPYENEVRYLVTSLDTRFQQTSTGVFIAFHHLEQAFNPVSDQPAGHANEIEMQRLQLMLTQDLNVLADFASNWAVSFNVELSRGVTPYQLSTDDELHKKLTGGISVSF